MPVRARPSSPRALSPAVDSASASAAAPSFPRREPSRPSRISLGSAPSAPARSAASGAPSSALCARSRMARSGAAPEPSKVKRPGHRVSWLEERSSEMRGGWSEGRALFSVAAASSTSASESSAERSASRSTGRSHGSASTSAAPKAWPKAPTRLRADSSPNTLRSSSNTSSAGACGAASTRACAPASPTWLRPRRSVLSLRSLGTARASAAPPASPISPRATGGPCRSSSSRPGAADASAAANRGEVSSLRPRMPARQSTRSIGAPSEVSCAAIASMEYDGSPVLFSRSFSEDVRSCAEMPSRRKRSAMSSFVGSVYGAAMADSCGSGTPSPTATSEEGYSPAALSFRVTSETSAGLDSVATGVATASTSFALEPAQPIAVSWLARRNF